MFQFLIGRLEMQVSSACCRGIKEFQFLIGRLEIKGVGVCPIAVKSFNSL